MLLLDHKFMLPKYDSNSSRFVGLEVCAIGQQTLWILPGTPCLWKSKGNPQVTAILWKYSNFNMEENRFYL